MGEDHDSPSILRDISLLYELSLSVGASLELVPCCDAFLRTLMARKALDFASVWVRGDRLRPARPPEELHLVYGNPDFRVSDQRLAENHAFHRILAEDQAFSITSTDPHFEELVTERGVTGGSIALFPLEHFGLLKLYSSDSERVFSDLELNQLRNVVDKFAIALEGCIAHELLRWEVEERKRLEQQVLHSQKLESLGILAGGVAHDFNNLLTGILGNANLARQALPAHHESHGFLASIERASEHAADLCDHLLAYAGKGQLLTGTLALDDVLRDVRPLLEVSVSKKVQLEFRFGEDLPAVEGDAAQICQIVMNLVTNASDAIGDAPGSILVSTGCGQFERPYFLEHCLGEPPSPGEYVYMEVRDTGTGMHAETRERIFDPFFTTKFAGRGLGLAAVQGIVRSHQGAVAISSRPGAGTAFRVLFPRAEPRPREVPAAGPSASLRRGQGRVLLADDEQVVREVLEEILDSAGFEVVAARDGREGVQAFEAAGGDFDLVLLDLTMPNLNGVEALREIRCIREDVPVLLCSGYSDDGLAERLQGQKVTGFLKKPFRAAEVIDTICSILDARPVRSRS